MIFVHQVRSLAVHSHADSLAFLLRPEIVFVSAAAAVNEAKAFVLIGTVVESVEDRVAKSHFRGQETQLRF